MYARAEATGSIVMNSAVRIAVGVLLGLAIAATDSFAFHGEISPAVIAAMLLLATLMLALAWGTTALPAAAGVWVCTPLAHAIKFALHLPDTLQPNTAGSIGKLAAFTLLIAAVGAGGGIAIHRQLRSPQWRRSR
jgi:hypothetical protein